MEKRSKIKEETVGTIVMIILLIIMAVAIFKICV